MLRFMLYLSPVVAALLTVPPGWGQERPAAPAPREAERPPPGVIPADPPNPDYIAQLAAAWEVRYIQGAELQGQSPEERAINRKAAETEVSYWRFISWHGWAADPDRLAEDQTGARYFLNTLHLALAPVPFRAVPGSNGLLWWFDLRAPDWTVPAWSAVARRDLMFTDETVNPRIAEYLRRIAGIRQDPKTLSLEVIVWGPQLLRDVFETQRSPSAYDLLYGRQRFVPTGTPPTKAAEPPTGEQKWREEKRIVTHPGGKFVFPDDTGRVRDWEPWTGEVILKFKEKSAGQVVPDLVSGFKFVDFPETLDDWENFYRIQGDDRKKAARASAFGKAVDVFQGAVVAGYHDDPVLGSIVARKNRAIRIEQGAFGPVMETFDTADGSGTKDYLEQAVNIARGLEPDADAYEVLAGLPAGGLAKALFKKDKKRIEVADGGIAKGPQPLDPALKFVHHPQVRNGVDCDRCHAIANGVIPPRSLVDDAEKAGLRLTFANPADKIQFDGVFKKLDRRIQGYQVPYAGLIEDVTKGPEADAKAWTPAKLVGVLERLMDAYDAPVTPDRAAAEIGLPEAVVRDLRGPAGATLTARPKMLMNGKPCPRDAWDKDVRILLVRHLQARRQMEPPHK